jgi:hypothetical protein
MVVGTAMRMYVPQSRKASLLKPAQVRRPGSCCRLCCSVYSSSSSSDSSCTLIHAAAAPSRPRPSLRGGRGP